MRIEHAGGSSMQGAIIARSGVVERAPKWWRDLAARSGGGKVAPVPRGKQAPAKAIGWVCGLACGGVSLPCRSATDSRDLPEQFHPDALLDMAQQCNSQKRHIGLLWGHNGPEVTSNAHMDLLLRMVTLYGMPALAMDARIRSTQAGQKALEQLEAGLLGISICFRKSSHYHAERPGYGITRVITSAELDHIALVPKGSSMRAAYPACTAKGERTQSVGPSGQLRDAVMDRARDHFKAQAMRMA